MQNNAFGSATEETVSQKLFDLSGIQLFGNDHGSVSFQEMCGWINDSTIENCLATLRNMTEQRTDWAMEGTNVYLLNKVKTQIGYALSPNEQVLFFKDSGIFANGKSGVLITNKTLCNFSKKGVYKLPIADIFSIHALALAFGTGEWYFNANKNWEIDNMACTPTEQGLIMALVCLLAKECHAPGYRIKVYKGTR